MSQVRNSKRGCAISDWLVDFIVAVWRSCVIRPMQGRHCMHMTASRCVYVCFMYCLKVCIQGRHVMSSVDTGNVLHCLSANLSLVCQRCTL